MSSFGRGAKTRPDRRRSASFVALTALFTLIASILLPTFTASAAELTPTLTNSQVLRNGEPVSEDADLLVGATLRFQTEWSFEGMVNSGDTFEVPLPSGVTVASTAPFDLLDGTTPIAHCTYDVAGADAIECTFADGGPFESPSGDVWFNAYLEEVTDGQAGSWDVGGVDLPLPIPHAAPPGGNAPKFGTYKSGSGSISEGIASMDWYLYMWPGAGPNDGQVVTEFQIEDQLSSSAPNSPHHIALNTWGPDNAFLLQRWQRDGDSDREVPGSRTQVVLTIGEASSGDKGEIYSAPEVSADGTSYSLNLSNLQIGYQYRLIYKTVADGAVSFEGDVFANTATLNGVDYEHTITPHANAGGGADAGDYYRFVVTKKLTDATVGADLPDSFTLQATDAAGTHTVEVPADGAAVLSPYFATSDGPLTLCEQIPAVPGVDWAPYTIAGSGVSGPDSSGCFTLSAQGGSQVEIVLNNEAASALGGFSVTKSLSGDGAALVPDGTVFTVDYSYPAGDGFDAGAGSVEVSAGQTATVDDLPANAVVTLTEVTATDPQGAAYGEPVFDQASFTIVKDAVVQVNLDNPVGLNTGQFSVQKVIEGSGADLVAQDAAFVVTYSYPAGVGFEAGEGELTVLADGSVTASEPLPYGAEVTLEETDVPQVDGGSWASAEFSQSEFTIGDGAVVDIVLTNTITADEVPPTPEETEPPTPEPSVGAPEPPVAGPDRLAETGLSAPLSIAWIAGGLLTAGVALLMGGRRQKRGGSA